MTHSGSKVYYDAQGIRVTSDQVDLKTHAFLLEDIKDVQLRGGQRIMWPGLIALSLAAVVLGSLAVYYLFPDYFSRYSDALFFLSFLHLAIVLPISAALALVGVILLLVWRRRHVLVVATSHGEKQVELSGDAKTVGHIITAVRSALAEMESHRYA